MLSLIVAVAENGVIGADGEMPWHLPEDLKFFQRHTLGKPILMGRRTFASLGKALPRRDNLVLTSDPDFAAPNVQVVRSLEEARQLTAGRELMVAGGTRLYAEALPIADCLYRTLIAARPEGDTYFPDFDQSQWRLAEERHHPADANNPCAMRFQRWLRAG